MVERPAIPDYSEIPEYSMQDVLELRTEEELRAVADGTRRSILRLLRERAASTTELAEALDQPKGTVAHHLKVLEETGLIRVVHTRKVRAMTERYYGRIARLYRLIADEGDGKKLDIASLGAQMLRDAADEVAPDAGRADDPSSIVVAHARVPAKVARTFVQRLEELAADFGSYDDTDERIYGFVIGVYATDLRDLPKKKKGRKRG
jgi:DNA-binding transcriptional ArsR family regulator